MKKRHAIRFSLRHAEQGGVRGHSEQYRAGYQAGYALGLKLGEEDRGNLFEGTSIIIPADPYHDGVMAAVQHVQVSTSHPYEIIIANAGASPNARQYIYERRGTLRHIQGKDGEHLALVMKKAITASLGEYVLILIDSAVIKDDWVEILIREFEREPDLKVVYACMATFDMTGELSNKDKSVLPAAESGDTVSCLMFRRTLPDEIGLWPDEPRSLNEYMLWWLERISPEHRLQIEATTFFTMNSS